MRVLFVSSEIFPLAKTGGLADVSAALPRALAELGVHFWLLMPAYPTARQRILEHEEIAALPDFLAQGPARLIGGRLPETQLPVLLLDAPELYDRPGGPYLDPQGHGWPDNALRFGVLSRVAAWIASGGLASSWRADLVHANDWHTGLVPLWLRAVEPRVRTLFTIHNMAFQGVFPASILDLLALPHELFTAEGIEFYGQISFLKAGIRYSYRLTTVSPTYAKEIQTAAFGCGLDGVVRERATALTGILNGVDRHTWDPATDRHLPAHYSAANLSGKRTCKAAVQRELGLEPDEDAPLVAFISRLTSQKMAEVVAEALDTLMDEGGQFALVGDGDKHLEALFRARAEACPRRSAARIGYEEGLAHRLYAGADVMLAPARFEPCGLTPIYAMLYGTVPVVRNVGGLADTVVGAEPRTIQAGTANGFSFAGEALADLSRGISAALAAYREPVIWRKLQLQGMRRDWSWKASSARAYFQLYRALAAGSGPAIVASAPLREADALRADTQRSSSAAA